MTGNAKQLATWFGSPLLFKPLTTPLNNGGNAGSGFYVVHQRWFAAKPFLGRIRRFESRHTAASFERFQQCGLFAANISAVPLNDIDRKLTNFIQRVFYGRLQGAMLVGEFATNVDKDIFGSARNGRDRQTLDHLVRLT